MVASTSFIGAPSFHGQKLGTSGTRARCSRHASVSARPVVRRVRPFANAEEAKKTPVEESPPAAAATPAPATPTASEEEYQVPGKIVLTAEELAEQKAGLDKYTLELRKRQMELDREAARLFGWVPYAETMNGRFAMFFIAVGVLTEYWTGYTIPQQVELMLRTLGII